MVAALVLAGCTTATGRPRDFVVDAPARTLPDQQLATVDAEGFEGVLAGLTGRPVVVNVWASWCGPCRVESPLLQRASERYRGQVTFLGVASKDDIGGSRAFLHRYGITYPNLFDATGDVRRALELRGFPTTYFFSARGRLLSTVVGGVSEQTLATRVEDALSR